MDCIHRGHSSVNKDENLIFLSRIGPNCISSEHICDLNCHNVIPFLILKSGIKFYILVAAGRMRVEYSLFDKEIFQEFHFSYPIH